MGNQSTRIFGKWHKIILAVFLIYSCMSNASTCPSWVAGSATNPNPSSDNITTTRYSYTSYSGTVTYGVFEGPVSNSLYYMSSLSPGNNAVVRKVNVNGTCEWQTLFTFVPSPKSLQVDKTEQNVYLSRDRPTLYVLILSASNGSIVSQKSYSDIFGSGGQLCFVLNDNSAYFIIGYQDIIPFYATICKYTFSSSTAQCQIISNVYYGSGHLMLSPSQFFLFGHDFFPPYHLNMDKITFSSISPNWVKKLSCSSSSCFCTSGESLLSADRTAIYVFFNYGSHGSPYLYFAAIDAYTGSVLGTRYKSAINISSSYGSALIGDYVITSTVNYLVMYSISSSSFTIKTFSGGIYSLIVDKINGRIILTGFTGSNGYTSKFDLHSINSHSDFTAASWLFGALSSGTDSLNFVSGVTIDSVYSLTPSSASYASQQVEYVLDSTSDVYNQTSAQLISVIEKSITAITPNLSCSYSGKTKITYSSINDTNTFDTIPWISLNTTTGALAIKAPSVEIDTEYNFYVKSKIFEMVNPVQTSIILTVQKCKTCSNSLTLGQILGIAIICSIGITALFSAVTSLMNVATMASMWSMGYQVQMLFLLLLSRSNIPSDVSDVIKGPNFTINVYSYIPIKKISFIDDLLSPFNFDLTNSVLDNFGIESDSSIYNTYPTLICIICMTFLHICLYFMLMCELVAKDNRCCRCLIKIAKRVVNKTYKTLTFGYYIRNSLEMSQFILICSIYEITKYNTFGPLRTISIIFAISMVLLYLILIIVITSLALSSYKVNKFSHSKLGEFFCGIKEAKINRCFIASLLARKVVYIALLLTLVSISSKLLVCILSTIQLLFVIYTVYLKPFEEMKGNIVQIINEFYLLLMMVFLIFTNKMEDWNPTNTSIYTWIVFSNSIVSFLIISGDGIRLLIKWFRFKYLKFPDLNEVLSILDYLSLITFCFIFITVVSQKVATVMPRTTQNNKSSLQSNVQITNRNNESTPNLNFSQFTEERKVRFDNSSIRRQREESKDEQEENHYEVVLRRFMK